MESNREHRRDEMENALRAAVAPSAMLMGLETAGEAMRDETLRLYLGHTLLREILPCRPAGEKDAPERAAALCGRLEGAEKESPLRGDATVGRWKAFVLPLVKRFEAENFALPPCLCFSLAALIMQSTGGKNGAGEEGVPAPFTGLSCDMPPESLAYAVLADREAWEEDLREIPGLEDTLTDILRDLQLLGLRAAMEKSWKERYGGKE